MQETPEVRFRLAAFTYAALVVLLFVKANAKLNPEQVTVFWFTWSGLFLLITFLLITAIYQWKKERKPKPLPQPEPVRLKEGDLLVDRNFGADWNLIEVKHVGAEDPTQVLFQFHTVKGKQFSTGDLYKSSTAALLTEYKLI